MSISLLEFLINFPFFLCILLSLSLFLTLVFFIALVIFKNFNIMWFILSYNISGLFLVFRSNALFLHEIFQLRQTLFFKKRWLNLTSFRRIAWNFILLLGNNFFQNNFVLFFSIQFCFFYLLLLFQKDQWLFFLFSLLRLLNWRIISCSKLRFFLFKTSFGCLAKFSSLRRIILFILIGILFLNLVIEIFYLIERQLGSLLLRKLRLCFGFCFC